MSLTIMLFLVSIGAFQPPQIGNLHMPTQVWAWTLEASADARINPYHLAGLMAIESRFDPRASSERGRCYGLMQLDPEAARWAGVDRYDPRQNILGGARVLAHLLRKHQGNLAAAAKAYNGKLGNGGYVKEVARAAKQAERSVFEHMKNISKGNTRPAMDG